jgi:anti-sigma regulatory factor (Ser/Thr protein kinase)
MRLRAALTWIGALACPPGYPLRRERQPMPTATVRGPCQPPFTAPDPITTTLTRSFPGRPEAAGAARAWIAGIVADSQAADTAVLGVSELFTNAILHSASGLPGGLVAVTLRITSEAVRVDVVDEGELPSGTAMSHGLGAGLAIVSQLADVFGADGRDRWFMVRAASSLPVAEALERAERNAACDDGPEGR